MVLNRLLFDATDCDDLRQDILLKLWEKLKSYDDSKSKFRTWLSTVIRNRVLNYFRDKDKATKNLAPEGEHLLYAESTNELEEHIQAEWETYAANLALERIKPLFSDNAMQVFNLYLDNNSVNDIAIKLSISADSVYKMRTRVVKRLQDEVKLIRSETEF